MIRGATWTAAALALLAGACQSMDVGPQRTAMDGSWASSDGVFTASFSRGSFTSRFTKTNEILAQGTYEVIGNSISMRWLSVATQQQRAATCSFAGPGSVHCIQEGGAGFDLNRTT